MTKILNIGHRGAKGHTPENTLASFQKALDLGVDGIELDVHLSLDGKIVVIHDETLDRTTNGKGLVNALTMKTLRTFSIDNEHSIPSLQEVLDLIDRRCFVNVELKGNATAEPVTSLIEKYIAEKNWQYSDFIVSSFDWKMLQEIRDLNPKIPIGVLTATDLDLAIAFAEHFGAYAIHPYYHLLTSENTRQMQKKGLKVFAWTVNETQDLAKIKSFNPDGIITDFPDKL
ncbi:MAG TPA: glycerophosphodiester phosphodiesterase family protein [Flavobacterium sp.]|jgi:glycerophosphoryl diester phosphodiesterase|nr:glycerophosphodiester phosphodiesterase family protein [Flavobacterium sp.]HPJ10353.1 glycerophosphodiester phosphodiesterase family protein [Flavobacterium sp.]